MTDLNENTESGNSSHSVAYPIIIVITIITADCW